MLWHRGREAVEDLESFHTMLVDRAVTLGAHAAGILAANDLRIEDRFATMCADPPCPGYGQSMNCPPHGMGPSAFRKNLGTYDHVLGFKFDVPTDVLLSSQRDEVFRLLHETAAALEREALKAGCRSAFGMAGGSCKALFCADESQCRVLGEGGPCRHPESARPSMSGLGVHVQDLCGRLGWPMEAVTRDTDAHRVPMGLVVGAVLLGGFLKGFPFFVSHRDIKET